MGASSVAKSFVAYTWSLRGNDQTQENVIICMESLEFYHYTLKLATEQTELFRMGRTCPIVYRDKGLAI